MSDKGKSVAKQLSELAARLDRIEGRLGGSGAGAAGGAIGDADEPLGHCTLPDVPERTFEGDVSAHRARLIRYIDKKWVNGTKLRYCFFGSGPNAGAQDQKEMVRRGFRVWEDIGIGITFEEVARLEDAEVRIAFRQGIGSWSYVGRDIIDAVGALEPTMNFGWDLTLDPRGVDTPVHEIGHTLGFPHEHQNPFSGIVWDEDAVYDYFGGPPNNWSRADTFRNVLRKLPTTSVEGSAWDPDSVMHYGFPGGLITRPERYRGGLRPELGLSDLDVEEVRRFYPPLDDDRNPRLEPYRLEMLSLEPAGQKNFTIEPAHTDEFTIQTFGRSDTVMVLFEDVDGDLRYLEGDDDSGTRYNARIESRLQRGRRYVLRVRLYLNWASGDTALMMW